MYEERELHRLRAENDHLHSILLHLHSEPVRIAVRQALELLYEGSEDVDGTEKAILSLMGRDDVSPPSVGREVG